MARARKANWRRIKRHRNYTVDEVARVLGVCKGTVRRWVKTGLPALIDKKPLLILGDDLIAFHKAKAKYRQKCQPHECYCVKCRAPRPPAGDMAEYIPIKATNGNLRALCPDCETLMHKRVNLDQLSRIRGTLQVSIPQALARLMDSPNSSTNVHLVKEPKTHA